MSDEITGVAPEAVTESPPDAVETGAGAAVQEPVAVEDDAEPTAGLDDLAEYFREQVAAKQSETQAPATAPQGIDEADWNEYLAFKAFKASKGAAPAPAEPAAPAVEPKAEPQPVAFQMTQEEFDTAFDTPEAFSATVDRAVQARMAQMADTSAFQQQFQQDYEQRMAGLTQNLDFVAVVNAALLNPENAALRKNIPALEAALKYVSATTPGLDQWELVSKACEAVRDREVIAAAVRRKQATVDTRPKTAKTTPGTAPRTADPGTAAVTDNMRLVEAFRRG